MEFWVFEVVTVIVAHMGSVVVGTNQILLTITRYVASYRRTCFF